MVDSAQALVGAMIADRGLFALTYSMLLAHMPSSRTVSTMSLTMKRGDHIRPADVIEKLLSLGYKHDPDTIEGTYRLDGDTLHIRAPKSDDIVSISYFGDEVDDIQLRHAIVPDSFEAVQSISFPATTTTDTTDLVFQDSFDADTWRT